MAQRGVVIMSQMEGVIEDVAEAEEIGVVLVYYVGHLYTNQG